MPKLFEEGRQKLETLLKNLINLKGGSIDPNWIFISSKTKINVTCKNGHQWGILNGDLKRGRWCPECYGHKVNEEDVRKLIENKGGKVDEDWKYVNNNTKIWITCNQGHRWRAIWNNLRKGHWCPFCNKHAIDVDVIKDFIKNKNAIISKDWIFVDTKTKFEIKCENGHIFKSCWDKIRVGHWCPFCYGNNKPDEVRIKEIIKLKNGHFDLNWKYINAFNKFYITCEKGHRWQAVWGNLRKGHWCPFCLNYKLENEFREFIEKYTGIDFPSTRPDWLRNPETKRCLQLDGYNKEKKIAFEYQGKQHYDFCYTNGYSESVLKGIQKRDFFKKEICSKRNVQLIVIPYWIPKNQWESYVQSSLTPPVL
jgi:hypothetical protein